jgi:hypothetical protein
VRNLSKDTRSRKYSGLSRIADWLDKDDHDDGDDTGRDIRVHEFVGIRFTFVA